MKNARETSARHAFQTITLYDDAGAGKIKGLYLQIAEEVKCIIQSSGIFKKIPRPQAK